MGSDILQVTGFGDMHIFGVALSLRIEHDPSCPEYVYVMEPSIGLNAFALTRDDLLEEINEQLVMLWDEYANAADDELDAEAQRLKCALIGRISAGGIGISESR